MGKKTKEAGSTSANLPNPERSFDAWRKKWVGGGVLVSSFGFLLLLLTDPMGRNWASHLSPVLILAGYGWIAAALLVPSAKQ